MNLKTWIKEYKERKQEKIFNQTLQKLYAKTVTIHGRMELSDMCNDPSNGLKPEVRRMYWMLLQMAPINEWSNRN